MLCEGFSTPVALINANFIQATTLLSKACTTFVKKREMSYQSRKKYKSRREKNETTRTNAKRILTFIGIGILLWVILNRVRVWDWIRLQFYN
mgnify:CR=1 FL=1